MAEAIKPMERVFDIHPLIRDKRSEALIREIRLLRQVPNGCLTLVDLDDLVASGRCLNATPAAVAFLRETCGDEFHLWIWW